MNLLKKQKYLTFGKLCICDKYLIQHQPKCNMGRRSFEESNIRSLTKIGGGTSYAITLPIDIVRELKWKEKQKLTVTQKGNTLIIADWKKKAK